MPHGAWPSPPCCHSTVPVLTALLLSLQGCPCSHDFVTIVTALPIPWHPISTNLSTLPSPQPYKAALLFMTLSPIPKCSPSP